LIHVHTLFRTALGPVSAVVTVLRVESISHAIANFPRNSDINSRAIIPLVRLMWGCSSHHRVGL